MSRSVFYIGRSADIHVFCFQAAKRSDMNCIEVQVGQFADCEEWHFQAAKCSERSRNILQECRFPHAQK